jgi:hypothetical protein
MPGEDLTTDGMTSQMTGHRPYKTTSSDWTHEGTVSRVDYVRTSDAGHAVYRVTFADGYAYNTKSNAGDTMRYLGNGNHSKYWGKRIRVQLTSRNTIEFIIPLEEVPGD